MQVSGALQCWDDVAGYPLLLTQNEGKPGHLAVLPGFLSPSTLSALQEFIAATTVLATQQGAVSGFLQYRGTETLEEVKAALQGHNISVEPKACVWIEALADQQAALSACSRNTRRGLKEVDVFNLKFEPAYNPAFAQHYAQVADKNDFSQTYRYDDKTLAQMATADGIYPLSVYDAQGRYIGGALTGKASDEIYDTIIHAYDLEVSSASRAVLWGCTRLIEKLGGRYNNLGGGVVPYDGLHAYKMSYGGIEKPFYSIKIIFDEEGYQKAYGHSTIPDQGRFPA